jgi:excisionase family DNA binding protein
MSAGTKPDWQEWMDLTSLTRYAAVSERTLRGWVHRPANPLPAVRVGGKLLVSKTKFDKWLETHQLQSVDVACIVDEVVAGVMGTN